MKKKLIKKSKCKKAQEGFNFSKVTGGNVANVGTENSMASKQGWKNYKNLINMGMDEDKALNILTGKYMPGMTS